MTAKRKNTPNPWRDPDDAPELDARFFERADLRKGDALIRRGRPPLEVTKIAVTIRYDADILAAYKATGKGWQTRMNDALRLSLQAVSGPVEEKPIVEPSSPARGRTT